MRCGGASGPGLAQRRTTRHSGPVTRPSPPPSLSVSPPPVVSADLIARLREDLRRAGYTVEGMGDLLGPVASAALHREQPLPADRATASAAAGPAATLLRCFVLGLPVGSLDLEVALPRTGVGGLLGLGLVRRSADGAGGPGVRLQATCDLRPYGTEQDTWWVAPRVSFADHVVNWLLDGMIEFSPSKG